MMADKKELRKYYLNIRNKVKRESASEILERLSKNTAFINAKTVFCYVSFGSEPDTGLLLEEILKSKKRLAVPRCIDKKGNMIAVEVSDLSELKEGTFGIKEPAGERGVRKEDIDLCIVPGVSFDKKGYRLGYGGGYYDRFLENCPAYTVGICFKETFSDSLLREEKDVPVNEVIVL